MSVVNLTQIHAFGKTELTRAKTDKADARLIARYCQMHHPATWTPPADEIVTLQALVQRLDDLLGLQNMENNRPKAAELAARPSIEAILAAIDKQIEAVRKQIMGLYQMARSERPKILLDPLYPIDSVHGIQIPHCRCPTSRRIMIFGPARPALDAGGE